MSNNKELTELERTGLIAHKLAVDSPSQLSDAFRLGVAWALKDTETGCEEALGAVEESKIKVGDKVKVIGGTETEYCHWDAHMDKYIGKVCVVSVTGEYIELELIPDWYFSPEWLEVVV